MEPVITIPVQRDTQHGKRFGRLKRGENLMTAPVKDSSDRKWYIVPLCRACNKKGKEEVFEVRDNDLVAVNS